MNMNKIEALSRKFSVPLDEIEEIDDQTFNVDGHEYLVLTDEEANDKVREYIESSLWAFDSNFLACHCSIDTKIIQLLQRRYEDGNEALRRLIRDFVHFVDDAISADGRGHFLNTYDGEEIKIDTGEPTEDRWLYAYVME